MNQRTLRRWLTSSLAALLLLPIILAVTLGTAALLAAVGDATAAAASKWVALGLGMLWVVAVVATAAGAGMVALTRHDEQWRGHLRRRRARWRHERRAWGGRRRRPPDFEPEQPA
jgi:hypothetical protein